MPPGQPTVPFSAQQKIGQQLWVNPKEPLQAQTEHVRSNAAKPTRTRSRRRTPQYAESPIVSPVNAGSQDGRGMDTKKTDDAPSSLQVDGRSSSPQPSATASTQSLNQRPDGVSDSQLSSVVDDANGYHDGAARDEHPHEASSKKTQFVQAFLDRQAQAPSPESAHPTNEDIDTHRSRPLSDNPSMTAAVGQSDHPAYVNGDKPWASHQSPLQRLEVAYGDMNKEEKRARIIRAERRLQAQLDAKRRENGGDKEYMSRSKNVPVNGVNTSRTASDSTQSPMIGRTDSSSRSVRFKEVDIDSVSSRERLEKDAGIPATSRAEFGASNHANGNERTSAALDGIRDLQDLSPQHRHRFTDLFQWRPSGSKKPKRLQSPGSKPAMEEWRRAGTATLTNRDFVVEKAHPKTAWWETPSPAISQNGQQQQQVSGPTDQGMKRHSRVSDSNDSVNGDMEVWRGSVMIVTDDAKSDYSVSPILRLFPEPMEKLDIVEVQSNDDDDHLPLHHEDPIAGLPKLSRRGTTVYVKPVDDLQQSKDLSREEENDDGLFEEFRTAAVPTSYGSPDYRQNTNSGTSHKSHAFTGQSVRGARLHAEQGVTFWRFNLEIELQREEIRIAYSINNGPAVGFWIPGQGETMNMMFHTCNGFSMSVNPDDFSGPDPLWRDVLNTHQSRPFHVMIGGGDQIYNDAVMHQSPLFQQWLQMKNPHHKHEAPFTQALREELDAVYLERYANWFSQGLFGMATSQIPMVNIWDDHDIIDGFGSYPDHFMKSPVFCGLGEIAFKYYMLFQHQSVISETSADEPSWVLGASPGPYIEQLSRSIFLSLGKKTAFLGLDCRTERKRDVIVTEETYALVFDRCRREIVSGDTKHLIVLLGVPIAYPRLVWLENVLTSRALDPIKAIGRTGILGGFLNKFDGGVEILDDLDDHWTARNHKRERNWFMEELQELAAERSVRVTILGGDVHLAAAGQFYSNPALGIPKDKDHRYMVNVISSAIVNTPPPDLMSDILNKRNKVHHLDDETDEAMIAMFRKDVDGHPRNNQRLMPRRNWCSIRECDGILSLPSSQRSSFEDPATEHEIVRRHNSPLSDAANAVKNGSLARRLSGRRPQPADSSNASHSPFSHSSTTNGQPRASNKLRKNHAAPEWSATDGKEGRPEFLRRPTDSSQRSFSKNKNVDNSHHINLEYGLDIAIHCEINQTDPAGKTVPYRLLIPALFYDGMDEESGRARTRQGLLRRLSSRYARGAERLRGRRRASHQLNGAAVSTSSLSGSERTDDSVNSNNTEEMSRPRRWSFGLEKRREYRDQSPLQSRRSQQPSTSGPTRTTSQGYSTQPNGISTSDHSNHHHNPDPDSTSSPSGGTQRIVPERLDSVDYHANLVDTAPSGQMRPLPIESGKLNRMLGTQTHSPSPPNRPVYHQEMSDISDTSDQEESPPPKPSSRRNSLGAWRRSLSLRLLP